MKRFTKNTCASMRISVFTTLLFTSAAFVAPARAGGGTRLQVDFGSSHSMQNVGAAYVHDPSDTAEAFINNKGRFAFNSGSRTVWIDWPENYETSSKSDGETGCCLPSDVFPPVDGAYAVRPMMTFGDGNTSPIDLTNLPVDTPTNVALEISIRVPNIVATHTWTVIFRSGDTPAKLECEEGNFAKVTRRSTGDWTINTTGGLVGCLYETIPGKGNKSTTKFRGKIKFPIFVTLTPE